MFMCIKLQYQFQFNMNDEGSGSSVFVIGRKIQAKTDKHINGKPINIDE